MPQNYQTQDLWSRATSIYSYPFDELRSVLQKSIRRGLLEEAVLAAYEFYSSGAEAEEGEGDGKDLGNTAWASAHHDHSIREENSFVD